MKGSNPLRLTVIVMAAMMFIAVSVTVPCAEAFTKPVAGSFAYDVYKIGITDLLQGPAGFVGAALLIVLGIVMILRGQWPVTVGSFLAAGILAKAETILTSLGAVI
jgi:hypothetical protein